MLHNIIEYLNIPHNMIAPDVLDKIDPYESYTPRQVAKLGFIKNNVHNAHDVNFVLRLIQRGQLRAVNINKEGLRPTWRIAGQDIIDYLKTFTARFSD